MSELVKVFVYGTLKPGEANYDRYCKLWVVKAEAAIVYGKLYDLPLGYPALTTGNLTVSGFLLYFDKPDILTDLDELEDYQADRSIEANEYLRTSIDVFAPCIEHGRSSLLPLGQAWVYQMRPALIEQFGGVWLPGGEWTGPTALFDNSSAHSASFSA